MKFDNKIEELLGSGKITSEQAQALRNSLGNTATMQAQCHPQAPIGIIVAGFCALILGLLVWNTMSAPAQPQIIQNVAHSYNQPGGVGEMNKSMTTIVSILLLGLPAIIWFVASYNGLVNREERVLASWAQVESNYQRRTDLIPNLVKSVKAYAEHEGSTFANIAKLREQADLLQSTSEKTRELSQGSLGKLEDEVYMKSLSSAQQKVGEHLKTIMMTVEAYPNLRSSDQFLELQGQIEGTENRINVARMAFNESVGDFNAAIRRMPGSLLAGLGNFHRKAYFKSDEGADKAVKIEF